MVGVKLPHPVKGRTVLAAMASLTEQPPLWQTDETTTWWLLDQREQ
jgi:hypothetical protein